MTTPAFIFSVKQLNRYIKTLLESDHGLQEVWVRGELTDVTCHSSGHIYFSLKDDAGKLRCAMFRSAAWRLNFKPAEGLKVLARGRITLYEPMGQYQLVAEELVAEGVGALYLAFEALKKKLAAEGLFDQARKRPLPPYPKKIAVLTSPDGAAVHDIMTVIRRRWPPIHLLIVPTPVQGAQAVAGVVKSLCTVAKQKGIDLAILARGGGSPEELAIFNSEEIARAIVECPIPVVSAIGHEVDFTIADFVADLRAPTPSAAAEMVVPNKAEICARLTHMQARLAVALERRLESSRRELSLVMMQRCFRFPQEIVLTRAQRLDNMTCDLQEAMLQHTSLSTQRLENARARLEALSPLAVLKRGYAVVRKLPGEQIVRSVHELAAGHQAQVDFADGRAVVNVERVDP